MAFPASISLTSLDGTTGFRLDGAASYDRSGTSVASAGDVNGDGFDDLIVGAPFADSSSFESGSSYVVFGKAGGFAQTLNLSSLDGSSGFRLDGAADYDYSGRSVASAGDVNGDGFDDLIVGARSASSNGNSFAGSSYVVFGKAGGFAPTLNLSSLDGATGFRLDGAAARDQSGYSVASAGDVNGDGFDDLIVGARGADPNGDDSGSSYVVFGKAGGFTPTLDLSSLDGTTGFRLDGAADYDDSGRSAASAGDVNGDGFDDIIVGAYGADPNGNNFAGSSYVVFGKAGGFAPTLDLSSLDGATGFRLDGAAGADFSGISVASAGDVDGDGFGDLIVGANGADPNGNASGSSYVVFGKASGFAPTLDLSTLDGTTGFRLDGAAGGNYSGVSVASAGDVNDDGFDDLIVGANGADPNGNSSGSSYIVFGRETVAPVLQSALVNGSTLTLAYDEALDAASLPAASAFAVSAGGTAVTVASVAVSGSTVTLTLAAPVAQGQSVTVSYDDPNPARDDATGALQDAAGNDSASLLLQLVINSTPAPTPGGGGGGTPAPIPGPIVGTAGPDTLIGSTGADTLQGGLGSDTLFGQEGTDLLTGNQGSDSLFGNQGNDTLYGGIDDDAVYGGKDDDYIEGNLGNDSVEGNLGTDVVNGNQGNDTVLGNQGNDTVHGGQGDDLVHGGQDDDVVFGDRGNDSIWGDRGNDTLTGGDGADTFFFAASSGNDVVTDFNRTTGDRLDFQGQTFTVSEANGSAVFTLSGGGTVVLTGVSAASLDVSDFV